MAKNKTNMPDWSALTPVLPEQGPRARAVYTALRRMIEDGRLPPGPKLPPTRDLAARWTLARGAVVAGYEALISDGFAEARVGAGTFVAAAVPAPVRSGDRAAVPAAKPDRPAPAPFVPQNLPGDLGLAFPDPLSLTAFRRCLNHTMARPPAALFHYADPRGEADLRAEVADYLRMARGLRPDPARIVLTSGTQGGLDLVARAVLSPGDPVWMEDPGYPSGKAAFAAQALIPVPVTPDGLDVAAGRRLAPDARAAYVTPSHQFPLGVAMTMPRRLELLDWAAQAGAWVIEDDYDSEFRFAGAPLAALQGIDAAGRVIHVGTFSKSLMPGLRIGWLVLPDALVDPVLRVRGRVDRAPPGLTGAALAAFIRSGGFAAHLRRARRRVRQARDLLVAEFATAGIPVPVPDQGLHMALPLPAGTDDRALAADARTCGLGMRALSPMYLDNPQPGLVIGFSGHAPAVLADAARRWLATGALVAAMGGALSGPLRRF